MREILHVVNVVIFWENYKNLFYTRYRLLYIVLIINEYPDKKNIYKCWNCGPKTSNEVPRGLLGIWEKHTTILEISDITISAFGYTYYIW